MKLAFTGRKENSMNHTFTRGFRRKTAAVVILLLAGALTIPLSAGATTCSDAFNSCIGDALKVTVFSMSPRAGVIYGLGCISGYDWCMRYYTALK
jgi:hypothetical protein